MSNTCQCPNPPGGQVTCNDDQLAICGLRDGQIVSGCFDRPDHTLTIESESERTVALSNWALSLITGASRSDYDPIAPAELAMLRAGVYRDAATGQIVNFSLPRDLNLASAAQPAPVARSY
jgi:hypothetical protein